MKVLLVHNYYRSSAPSGEDRVYGGERELFQKPGQEVKFLPYVRYNDDIEKYSFLKKGLLPFKTTWSREAYRAIREVNRKEKPDIAHFHNIFYLISPSAYYACKSAGLPVVQSLHNFRFFCVNGLLAMDGRVCEECVGKWPWKGALRGCYRGSRFYSMPIALMQSLHKLLNTWGDRIDAYIALTEFGRRKFIECGLPAERIFVKPNFLLNPPKPNYSHDGYGVFLGRLSKEKGVNTLVEAFEILQIVTSKRLHLKLVGDGPMRTQLESWLRTAKIASIELTGRKDFSECMEMLKSARFMVMPSICYEGFPMTIIEAFACGKSVIASNLGAMASIVEEGRTGLLFEPGNPEDLASKIVWMLENEDACIEMGRNARRVFEEKYTAEKNYKTLMNIYQKVLENQKYR